MKSIVKTGKTVEEAVNDALEELNCTLDEATIEILEEPKSGFLGLIGGRNAVVKVSVERDDFKDLLRDDLKSQKNKEEDSEPAFEEKAKMKEEVKETSVQDDESVEEYQNIEGKRREEERKQEVQEVQTQEKPSSQNKVSPVFEDKKAEENPISTDIETEQDFTDEETVYEDEDQVDQAEKEAFTQVEIVQFCENWLDTLFDLMEIKGHAQARIKDDENIYIEIVDISDVDTGIIIGRRAETIDAIQYILSIALNRNTDKHYRVFLNVGGYRERRRANIEKMAKRNASKALKYKKSVSLEPMNAYERRIVHTTLQDFDGIVTGSEGKDPHRRVVIRLDK